MGSRQCDRSDEEEEIIEVFNSDGEELEFARAIFKVNPRVVGALSRTQMKNAMDLRAWDWAAEMVRAAEAGDPGPGSIDLALGTEAAGNQGYDEETTWGNATTRPILDDLGPDWGTVSVGNGACTIAVGKRY